MSLRVFDVRLLAVLSFALLAIGVAPAFADEDVNVEQHHVRMHRTYHHPRPMPVYVRQTVPMRVPVPVAVPQPYPVPLVQEPTYQPYYVQAAPAPVYSGCGNCGSAYVAPAPVYSGCGNCGSAYVAPAPVYSGCGNCGSAYVAPAPVYSGCGNCGGGYVPTSYCSEQSYDGQCTAAPAYAGAWPNRSYNRSGCAWAGGRWYCR
jgi:hypothetical protein